MITLRPGRDRGRTQFDWLDSRHTFSFGDYVDPAHAGFRSLRVLNDDTVQPGTGFGTHGHRDMEILTLVLDGALEHKDSTGTSSVIVPGEVQRMSAGSGIRHSEWNHSKVETVHFLQIWIVPDRNGLPPGYEQKAILAESGKGRPVLMAARDGADGAVTIHQDARLYGVVLQPGQSAEVPLAQGRHAWVHVARGAVALDGRTLSAGDGAALSDEKAVRLAGGTAAGVGSSPSGAAGEVLIFDLA